MGNIVSNENTCAENIRKVYILVPDKLRGTRSFQRDHGERDTKHNAVSCAEKAPMWKSENVVEIRLYSIH